MRAPATALLLTVALLSLLPTRATAFPWSKDMVDQPSVKPQEHLVRPTPGSVPADGKETLSVPSSAATLVRARILAGSALANPVPMSAASIERGKAVYDIHCLVCHGASGQGDGPVGKKFTVPPMNLTLDYVRNQPDGQIFYTITHGGIVMPFYRDAIPERDRWHVVNFVRSLAVEP